MWSSRRGDALMSFKRNSGIPTALLVAVIGMLVAAPAAFAAPQTPKTLAPQAVTADSAELRAELSPPAVSEESPGYYFEYAEGTECTGFRTTAPQANTLLAKGVVSEPVSGLEGNTTYNVCAVATGLESGTPFEMPGNKVSFTTLKSKPVLENPEAPVFSPYAAAVRATINPENETTSCTVKYQIKTVGPVKSEGCETSSLSGPNATGDGLTLKGLEPGATYEWTIVAKNGTGETTASGEFTLAPAEAPAVENVSLVSLTATEAELAATVRANFQETTYRFEYATKEAAFEKGEATVVGKEVIPKNELGNEEQHPSVKLHLIPHEKYFFRFVATNGTGKTIVPEPPQEFETYAVPAVVTGAATNETRTTAVLSGSVNPYGQTTFYHFVFEPQAQYDEEVEAGAANPFAYSRRTPEVSAGSEYTSQKIENVQISELKAGTVYVYALEATDPTGASQGAVQTFETSPKTPPVVIKESEAALNIARSSAEIVGEINTEGLPTRVWFEFERTGGTPSMVPATLTGVEGNIAKYAASFREDLTPGTSFTYWIAASNIDGEVAGVPLAFVTGALPNPFPAPTTYPLLPVAPTTTTTTTKTTGAVTQSPGKKHKKHAKQLKKALAKCHKQHNKKKRQSCERTAKKKYG